MDKFKRAIEQINKPIEEIAKQQAKEREASASAEAAKSEEREAPVSTEAVKSEEREASASTETAKAEEREASASTETVKAEEREASVSPEEVKADEASDILPDLLKSENDITAQKTEIQSKKQKPKKEKQKKEKVKKEKNKKAKPPKEKKQKPEKIKKSKDNNVNATDAEMSKPKKIKSKVVSVILLVIALLIVFTGIFNYYLNNQLIPTFYQVQSNKVVDNVRVVAISDLHLKEFGANNVKLVDKIASYHPDIIAVVGDMNIESNPDYSVVTNLCARLNGVAPVYYSLGNHEIDAMLFEDSQIYYDLKAEGIHILNNEVETVELGLSKIDIIGLTQNPKEFREYGKKFFDQAMESDDNFKLVLNHYPENFDGVLENYEIDLAICGHAHGGQVRLPIIGGLYSADQGLFPKLCDGYHEIGNSKVIITKGLGKSGLVPRINNPPEITIVDINWY